MAGVKFKSKSRDFIMLTERDLNSHDDYENFAKYLGIDYEDYYELVIGVREEEEEFVGITC
jgi:hypothetical protein